MVREVECFIYDSIIKRGYPKAISQISKAIKMHYPEKKGYSARSLTYMCQFARTYPLEILQRMLSCDKVLGTPTIPNMLSLTDELNCFTNYARTSCAISDKYISIKRIYARASCANSKR